MNDVFISYSTKDQAAKDELCAFLDEHDITYFLDSKDLELGEDIGENLKVNLQQARSTLMLVSANSLKSGWVGMETMFRLKEEETGSGRKLICVVVDNSVFDRDFPAKLQEHVSKEMKKLETLRSRMSKAHGGTEVYDIEINRLSRLNVSDIMKKVKNHLGVVLYDSSRKTTDLKKLAGVLKEGKTKTKPPVKEVHKNFTPSDTNLSTVPPQKGKVLYKIPPKMQLQNSHSCIIRVANTKEALLRGLDFPEAEASIRDDVRIADTMEVIFVPSRNFEITPVNSPIQSVDDDKASEWEFEVIPLAQGKFPLRFRVSAVLPNGKKEEVLRCEVEVVTERVPAALEFRVGELEKEEEAAEGQPGPKRYNIPNIHKLLDESMNDSELTTFCTLHFPKVAKQFASGQTKGQRVLILFEFAKSRLELDRLLDLMKNENSAAFDQYGPYRQ